MSLRSNMKDYSCGDTVKILVSNRPYIDYDIPPELNDYRNAETTNVKIYNPKGELVVDTPLSPITNKIGWYCYNYTTSCEGCSIGTYKVVITLESCNIDCGTPATSSVGTTGTTGTSGCGDSLSVCKDTVVEYFRVDNLEAL